MSTIAVAEQDFFDAASANNRAQTIVSQSTSILASALSSTGQMAGSDESSSAWATEYDPAARDTACLIGGALGRGIIVGERTVPGKGGAVVVAFFGANSYNRYYKPGSTESAIHIGRPDSTHRDEAIYGLAIPVKKKDLRLPTFEDAQGWPHFTPGAPPQYRPAPAGTVLFRLEPDGSWTPLRRF